MNEGSPIEAQPESAEAIMMMRDFVAPEKHEEFDRLANEGANKETLYHILSDREKEKFNAAMGHDDKAFNSAVASSVAFAATPFGGGPATAVIGAGAAAHAVFEGHKRDEDLEAAARLGRHADGALEKSHDAFDGSRAIVAEGLREEGYLPQEGEEKQG